QGGPQVHACGDRQKRRPKWRLPIKPYHRQIEERHRQPGDSGYYSCPSCAKYEQNRRGQEGDGETDDAKGQLERRAAELSIGGSRDHRNDLTKATVAPRAAGIITEAEPDSVAALLDPSRERAVVYQSVAYRFQPADSAERVPPHE